MTPRATPFNCHRRPPPENLSFTPQPPTSYLNLLYAHVSSFKRPSGCPQEPPFHIFCANPLLNLIAQARSYPAFCFLRVRRQLYPPSEFSLYDFTDLKRLKVSGDVYFTSRNRAQPSSPVRGLSSRNTSVPGFESRSYPHQPFADETTKEMDPNPPTPDPTVEQLVSVSTSGELSSVQAIFQEWKSAQDPVTAASLKEPNHAVQPALEAAVYKNQLQVITYFLEQGLVITERVVQQAIRAESTAALELFLEHGWDISTRWRHYKMPSIWYAGPLSLSHPKAQVHAEIAPPSPETISPSSPGSSPTAPVPTSSAIPTHPPRPSPTPS